MKLDDPREDLMAASIVQEFASYARNYQTQVYCQSGASDITTERADLVNIKFMSNQVVHNFAQVENTFNYNRFTKAVNLHQKEILHNSK